MLALLVMSFLSASLLLLEDAAAAAASANNKSERFFRPRFFGGGFSTGAGDEIFDRSGDALESTDLVDAAASDFRFRAFFVLLLSALAPIDGGADLRLRLSTG